MQSDTATQHGDRHVAIELVGLVLRIIATAIAINIVLGALVLVLAGQAQAAPTPSATVEAAADAAIRAARLESDAAVDPLLIVVHRFSQPAPTRVAAASEPKER